ncbi:hypothetical protein DFH11DRAFT_1503620 [Phellopilus nigrolimitatus]|nr:hypothetical protein DFH11DRAFT_1503620 [Phellopilus nigrolimitatus]
MSETAVQDALRALEHAVPIVKAGQYLTLSGCSLLLYDYFLTVELIWKAPTSTISLIYLANRYIIPLMLAIDIYDRLGLANPPSVAVRILNNMRSTSCKAWIWVEAYVTVFSFMSMHGLVAMRVHALFGGSRLLKTLLRTAFVLYVLPTLGLLGTWLYQGQGSLTVEPVFNTCFEEISPMLWTIWLPSLFLETLLFFLTTLKAIREARRNVYHPISSILYRDGIMYFLAIAAATMFCMFVWLIGSPLYEGLAKYWATAIVNIAGCRLVLSLKANARALQHVRVPSSSLGQSSSFVVGSDTAFADSGYTSDGDSDVDSIGLHRLQLGTVYPDRVQTHWDAL